MEDNKAKVQKIKEIIKQLESDKQQGYSFVNPEGGALGMYQFLPSTLNDLLKKSSNPELQKLAYLPDSVIKQKFLASPELQEAAANEQIEKVASRFNYDPKMTTDAWFLGTSLTGPKALQATIASLSVRNPKRYQQLQTRNKMFSKITSEPVVAPKAGVEIIPSLAQATQPEEHVVVPQYANTLSDRLFREPTQSLPPSQEPIDNSWMTDIKREPEEALPEQQQGWQPTKYTAEEVPNTQKEDISPMNEEEKLKYLKKMFSEYGS